MTPGVSPTVVVKGFQGMAAINQRPPAETQAREFQALLSLATDHSDQLARPDSS
jgi:hypothetical protein